MEKLLLFFLLHFLFSRCSNTKNQEEEDLVSIQTALYIYTVLSVSSLFFYLLLQITHVLNQ